MAEDFQALRAARPGLYYTIMTLALASLALATNFWTSNPTFNPYGISKNLIGIVFAALGASHLIFLLRRDLGKLRFGLTTSLGFMLFWGISNTQQSFAGNASFQLPILYISLATIHMPLLVELFWLDRDQRDG